MRSVLQEISRRVLHALGEMGVEADPIVRVSQDASFGDYQSNCAMALGKRLGRKPREVAETIVQHLKVSDLCENPRIAGPGFINFKLQPAFIAGRLEAIPPAPDGQQDRMGIERVSTPQTVVVDLSSPNLAKEMHVGHLRSTVIGDCVARILSFAGHEVHRENHVGDWGTQFGMLVAHLRKVKPEVAKNPEALVIRDLESFYVEAKARFDSDDEFKQQARETVVALQRGDPEIRQIWKAFCDESLRHCHAIYDRLGVELVDRGESFYTDLMGDVVARLEAMQTGKEDDIVRVSDGALCLFMDGFNTRDGDPLPLIVRKSDGGYNYATSDLATMIHRVEKLKATRIVYVVGSAQKQHFDMLFSAVRGVGWVDDRVSLQHLGFGNMLSKSGRPFKTREGGTAKLKDLLDEAVARARKVVMDQPSDEGKRDRAIATEEAERIAETVGVAAVKYFDLSHALGSDYKFDLDTMLALEGNTAPYMLYAYARIRSIGRKAGVDWSALPQDVSIVLEHPTELALAKHLLRLADTLDTACRDLQPNLLTEYFYGLARNFSRFYDKKLGVRVIGAATQDLQTSRLKLCDLTARALKLGLYLLGIETLEQM